MSTSLNLEQGAGLEVDHLGLEPALMGCRLLIPEFCLCIQHPEECPLKPLATTGQIVIFLTGKASVGSLQSLSDICVRGIVMPRALWFLGENPLTQPLPSPGVPET